MDPKILINALSVTEDHVGGDLTYVLQLCRHLLETTDLDIKVLMQASAVKLLGDDRGRVLPVVVPLGGLSKTARVVSEQVAVPVLIRSIGVGLFHATVNVAPLLSPCPYVLTLHEAEPFVDGLGLPGHIRAWWRFARARSAKDARLIFTVSRTSKGELMRAMGIPADKIVVTPLGVDRQIFWPDKVSASSWREHFGPYFLWVGAAYPRKNVGTLLEAFALLGRRDLRLVLVGPKGWASSELEVAIRQLGIGPQVVALGKRVGSELRGIYSGAEALVFPSRRETFGLPVLEAMACGTPVIASDIEVFREVAGEAALLVDTTSALALRDAMECLLSDDERRGYLQRRGLEWVSAYSWKRTSDETAKAYRMVLGCM